MKIWDIIQVLLCFFFERQNSRTFSRTFYYNRQIQLMYQSVQDAKCTNKRQKKKSTKTKQNKGKFSRLQKLARSSGVRDRPCPLAPEAPGQGQAAEKVGPCGLTAIYISVVGHGLWPRRAGAGPSPRRTLEVSKHSPSNFSCKNKVKRENKQEKKKEQKLWKRFLIQ